jgi:hypothetical protein
VQKKIDKVESYPEDIVYSRIGSRQTDQGGYSHPTLECIEMVVIGPEEISVGPSRCPQFNFTIRALILAVAAVAGLLCLAGGWGMLLSALSVPCIATICARWLVKYGLRHLATFGFWVPALVINALYSVAWINPSGMLGIALFLGWIIIFGPTIGILGLAWAKLATREDAVPRRSGPSAGLPVFALTILPALTLWTFWPLHLAFVTARPALEIVADQVATGHSVALPLRAGVFRIAGSAVDPVSGNVGLMIDPDPNGPTGFVRIRSTKTPNYAGPISGSDLEVNLGGGWCFRVED